jgi:hypothetical protein
MRLGCSHNSRTSSRARMPLQHHHLQPPSPPPHPARPLNNNAGQQQARHQRHPANACPPAAQGSRVHRAPHAAGLSPAPARTRGTLSVEGPSQRHQPRNARMQVHSTIQNLARGSQPDGPHAQTTHTKLSRSLPIVGGLPQGQYTHTSVAVALAPAPKPAACAALGRKMARGPNTRPQYTRGARTGVP